MFASGEETRNTMSSTGAEAEVLNDVPGVLGVT